MSSFKSSTPLAERKKMSESTLEQNRFPIVVEMHHDRGHKVHISPVKFSVTKTQTMAHLQARYREGLKAKNMGLNDSEALFFFLPGNIMAIPSADFTTLYEKYNDKEDGFLYIIASRENTFGSN